MDYDYLNKAIFIEVTTHKAKILQFLIPNILC